VSDVTPCDSLLHSHPRFLVEEIRSLEEDLPVTESHEPFVPELPNNFGTRRPLGVVKRVHDPFIFVSGEPGVELAFDMRRQWIGGQCSLGGS
jgi:hypothetical protein